MTNVRLRVRIARIPGVTPRNVLRSDLTLGLVLGDIDIQDMADWRDYATISAGQRTQPGGGRGEKGRGLRSLSLEVLTQWGEGLPYEASNSSSGKRIRQELTSVLHARAPFRLVATLLPRREDAGTELRMNATLRSLGRTTRHGQPDSRYLTLEVVEYRAASVERRSRTRGESLPTKHRIEKDDTLRKLAKRYYKGRAQGWKRIKEANRGLLKGYGPDEKLDKLAKGKQGTLRIPEFLRGEISEVDEGLGGSRLMATAEHKTPDLAAVYGRHVAEMPEAWNFRIMRVRLGRGRRRSLYDLGPYVESVDWSDEGLSGSGSVSFVKPDPDKRYRPLEPGDLVRVDAWYRGRWTQMVTMRVTGFPESDTMAGSVEMKDDLSLLTLQKRDWRYRKTKQRGRGWLPGQIAKDVAKQEGLRVGKISMGKHRIDKLEKKDAHGLDVIFAAYNKERAKTGYRYTVRIHNNRLEITPWRRSLFLLVVEDSIEAATITRKTKTPNPATVIEGKGRVGKGDGARKVKFRYKRQAMVRKFGLKEKEKDYGRVSSAADLRRQVKADYADEVTVHKSGSLTLTGIPYMRGQWGSMRKGQGIRVRIPGEGIDPGKTSWFWTTSVSHSISGGSYTCEISFDDGDPWLAYQEEQDKFRREQKRKARR